MQSNLILCIIVVLKRHFTRKLDPSCCKSDAEFVVKNCRECQSTDLSGVRINGGELSVEEDWKRLALDVTHHGCQKYLTIVDCGPNRFAIWRNIQNESEGQVVSVLRQIFSQFVSPIEILCDNAKSFRSNLMQVFCKLWKISLTFRCAYKPSGNGIVERNHRTIKRMSARCGKSIDYCILWYNIIPHGSKGIILSSKLISYEWRNPFLEVEVNSEIDDGQESNKRAYSVGDKVWVKPHGARCTSLWNPGIVTKVNSEHNVEVDGVPRHVCDMRRWADEGERDDKSLISANLPTIGPNFVSSSFESNFERDAERRNATLENGNDVEDESLLLPRRGLRARRLPAHLKEFFVNDDFEITGECN